MQVANARNDRHAHSNKTIGKRLLDEGQKLYEKTRTAAGIESVVHETEFEVLGNLNESENRCLRRLVEHLELEIFAAGRGTVRCLACMSVSFLPLSADLCLCLLAGLWYSLGVGSASTKACCKTTVVA